jgi:hypothetical protein
LSFAWTLVHAMKNKDLNTFAVPPLQLALIVLAAAVAAVVAAALPAPPAGPPRHPRGHQQRVIKPNASEVRR